MKKSVLLPYDRYQRLLSGMLENEASMSTSEQEHSPQHGSVETSPHLPAYLSNELIWKIVINQKRK